MEHLSSPASKTAYPADLGLDLGRRSRLAEFWQARGLLVTLVLRDVKLKYKGSVFGFLWSLLNPLLMLIVYTFAFDYVIKVRAVSNFPLFFFCAFLPWSFFSQALTMATPSLVEQAGLIRKIYFPREVLPAAVVLSNLVSFLLTFLVLFPALLLTGEKIGPVALLLPVLLLFHTLFTSGIALFLAAAFVHFRDLKYLVEVALTLWFWVTPIVYPLALVPESFKEAYLMNPMTVFTEVYRNILLYNTLPNMQATVKIILFTAVSLVIGAWYFGRHSSKVAEHV